MQTDSSAQIFLILVFTMISQTMICVAMLQTKRAEEAEDETMEVEERAITAEQALGHLLKECAHVRSLCCPAWPP